jgi:hypothetical protein
MSHDGELAQVDGLAVDVGPDVEQNRLAAGVGQHRGQRRAVHAGHRADHHLGDGEGRAGVAGGDHRLRPAFLDQLGA